MKLYLAADGDDCVYMYTGKPVRGAYGSMWIPDTRNHMGGQSIHIDSDNIPFELNGLSWFDDPVEVEIVPRHRPLGELRENEE